MNSITTVDSLICDCHKKNETNNSQAYKVIFYQKVLNWALLACIISLLLILPTNTPRHHVLERACDTAVQLAEQMATAVRMDFISAYARAQEPPAQEKK